MTRCPPLRNPAACCVSSFVALLVAQASACAHQDPIGVRDGAKESKAIPPEVTAANRSFITQDGPTRWNASKLPRKIPPSCGNFRSGADFGHWVAVLGSQKGRYLVADPASLRGAILVSPQVLTTFIDAGRKRRESEALVISRR